MAKKAVIAVACVAAVAALSWGGIAVSHSLKCSGLEEDYLNSIAAYRDSVSLSTLTAGNPKLAEDMKGLQKSQLEVIELSLKEVYDQCGTRAGQTASRKGSGILY